MLKSSFPLLFPSEFGFWNPRTIRDGWQSSHPEFIHLTCWDLLQYSGYMKLLDVDCPRCGCGCDLQLEADVHVVLLSCPGCQAPLVSYYGQTFQVEPSEFKYLRQKGGMQEAIGQIRQRQAASVSLRQIEAHHEVGESVLDHPVGADEILDLKIELASCDTIEDFLNRF